MSGKTISLGFRIEDGKDGLKQLTLNAGELRKAMQGSLQEASASLRKP